MAEHQFLPEKIRRPRAELSQAVLTIEGLGYTVAGSWRREKDTIGDLDIIVPHDLDFGESVDQMSDLFGYEMVRHGSMKSEGVANYKDTVLLLNLWRVPKPEAWAAMLLYTTGPVSLNIMMRAKAKSRGGLLSQYGLFDKEGGQLDDGTEEEIIFQLLQLQYLTPVERETWQALLIQQEKKVGTFIDVPASDGVHSYQVEVVNGKATDCECKGFSYRHDCRHLQEAERILRGRRRAAQAEEVGEGNL